jgi:hypothetical protein
MFLWLKGENSMRTADCLPFRLLALLPVLFMSLYAVLMVTPASAAESVEEPRIALLIGNSTYREAPLRNPVNDVRAMAKTLRELGFTVLAHENANKSTMERAILDFGRRLTAGGVGFFYYAGHGLQVRGRNFLIPVDAEIDSEATTRIAGVDVDLLLEQTAEARNRVNVVILDACRNNPFERRLRGASRGLSAVDAARGTLIAYATAPGSVAADGSGSNGLYTEELLKALRVPGLKVEEVFKRVRAGVTDRSNGAQTPWESSSLTGDLVFNFTVNVITPNSTGTGANATVDREAMFWASIKDSNDAAVFEAYLKQYPAGDFALLARRRIETLATPVTSSRLTQFDGTWATTVDCEAVDTAAAYSIRLFVGVKDGVLSGNYGIAGQPGFLTLDGNIQIDGSAGILANGITGDPKYNLNQSARGAPYSYRASAHFDATRGTGERLGKRPCRLSFTKQAGR